MGQVNSVLACAEELIGLEDPSQLPTALAGPLHDLIPYDFLVYNEINTATGAILTVAQPRDPESFNAVFEAFSDQHPLLRHYQRTRDPSVLRLSDHISRTELSRLDLYNDFFRHVGIEHEIVCTLPAIRTVAIGLVLTRERHDFSAEECELLAKLRPLIIRAYRTARNHAEVQNRLDTLQSALNGSGHAVMVFDATNEVVTASPGAESLLAAYGGGNPSALARRLDERKPLRLGRPGGHLVVTRVGSALLIDERRDPLERTRLHALGLSAREAEVLQSVADGSSNQAVADKLGISLRTVKKHLERIYEKLDVDSRTLAVARARATDN